MIGEKEQEDIVCRINSLNKDINYVYLKSKNTANIFKDKLMVIQKVAKIIIQDTSSNYDDFLLIIDDLESLKEEINDFFEGKSSDSEYDDDLDNDEINDNPLYSLIKIEDCIVGNEISSELVILELLNILDNGTEIDDDNLDDFSIYFENIQLIKQTMIKHKSKYLDEKNRKKFILNINQFEDYSDLFNYYQNNELSTKYNFLEKTQLNYPSYNKSILSLICKLTYIIYGYNPESYLMALNAYLKYKMIKSDQVVAFTDKKIFVDKQSEIISIINESNSERYFPSSYYNDYKLDKGYVIGIISNNFDMRYRNFFKIKFMYMLVDAFNIPFYFFKNLEYVYAKNLYFNINDKFRSSERYYVPKLKEVHFDKFDGSISNFLGCYSGNYKLIDEEKEKQKQKIIKQIKK